MNDTDKVFYTITENIEDHIGYAGQPLFKYIAHSNGSFTMSDEKGSQWRCSEEELTKIELSQIKEQLPDQSPTVPLWRRLNEIRTGGNWISGRWVNGTNYKAIIRTDKENEIANFIHQKGNTKEFLDREAEANAAYTALAVNNFSNIVEALEGLVKAADPSNCNSIFVDKAKEALSCIS